MRAAEQRREWAGARQKPRLKRPRSTPPSRSAPHRGRAPDRLPRPRRCGPGRAAVRGRERARRARRGARERRRLALGASASVRTMSAPAPLIHARGLVKRFGELIAVDGIDFEVAPRRVVRLPRPERRRQDLDDADDRRRLAARAAATLRVLGLDPDRDGPEIRAPPRRRAAGGQPRHRARPSATTSSSTAATSASRATRSASAPTSCSSSPSSPTGRRTRSTPSPAG